MDLIRLRCAPGCGTRHKARPRSSIGCGDRGERRGDHAQSPPGYCTETLRSIGHRVRNGWVPTLYSDTTAWITCWYVGCSTPSVVPGHLLYGE